jgi:[acyl-carrier-protein] S-malonyltransferase
VLGLDTATLNEICATASANVAGSQVVVANDNCPGQIVISGDKEAVATASTLAKTRGAKRVLPLNVSIASHSPLMASVTDEFAALVAKMPIVTAKTAIVGNTTARPITHPDDIRAELCAQLTSPVRWTESVQYMAEQGVTQFIELGPKDVLSNLIKRTLSFEGLQTLAIG